jgi:hypothetical protein
MKSTVAGRQAVELRKRIVVDTDRTGRIARENDELVCNLAAEGDMFAECAAVVVVVGTDLNQS